MLEELSIKGTQVCTVVQVAKILQSCPKMKKLDFTYTEKSQEEILSGLEKENISLESFATSFKKLTGLKLSTTVPDRKHDVFKDPWLVIIKMLRYSLVFLYLNYSVVFSDYLLIYFFFCSFCRDCTDLAIEITYTGKTLPPEDDIREKMKHLMTEQRVKQAIEKDWLPQLDWMKSLKSLVLVKLGPCASSDAGVRMISILLDSLTCRYLFPHREEKEPPRPLEHLWIQNFEIHRCAALK